MKTTSITINLKINWLIHGVILIWATNFSWSQEMDSYDFELKTVNNNDNSRSFIVDFQGKSDRETYPVWGAEVQFLNMKDEHQKLLGTAKTNENGIAKFDLTSNSEFLKDDEGVIYIQATFEGSEGIPYQETTMTFFDTNLSMDLLDDEDGKRISVSAFYLNASDEEVPIAESDIYFYVQGMITRLKIEDGWIEEGEYTFDFPDDLPGDKDGNLTIYARIEDSDEYGNVIKSANAKWGTGPISNPEKTHKLWSELGPEWMIGALSILLIGVWANIIHAIYNLRKIKREGNL